MKLCAWVAHLVERAPIHRGLLLDAAALGLTPTCDPLLHVIPPLSCPINKGLKFPKNNLKKKQDGVERFYWYHPQLLTMETQK